MPDDSSRRKRKPSTQSGRGIGRVVVNSQIPVSRT